MLNQIISMSNKDLKGFTYEKLPYNLSMQIVQYVSILEYLQPYGSMFFDLRTRVLNALDASLKLLQQLRLPNCSMFGSNRLQAVYFSMSHVDQEVPVIPANRLRNVNLSSYT
jgi:hypothetical protein